MKNEIIFILYARVQIYIIKLIKYIYLIIFSILSTRLNKSFNNHVYNINNTKLAFNLNILYLYKAQNKNNHIKKIEIGGLNKIIYRNIFHSYKLLQNSKIFNSNIETINIKKNINYLKTSGFIKNIKLTLIKMEQTKYFILHICTNPILKKFIIIDSKYLQIPTSLLISLFKKQIGLPQNYIHLNQSIKKIYVWYKDKGFDWINIRIIRDKKLEYLSLKIIEGKILKTKFICISTNNILKAIDYKIEKRIEQELNILPGSILNIRKIEAGINYLKDMQLINECIYKVIPYDNGLKLIIKYTIFKNQIKYLYKKNIIFNKIFIKRNILKNNFINYHQLFKGFAHQILKLPIYYKSMFINTSNNIILLNKYLFFQYLSFFNYLKYEKKFILDIYIFQKSPSVNIISLYPSIKIDQKIYGNVILNLYYQLNKLHHIYPIQAIRIANMKHLYNNKSYSKLRFKGIKILFKHYVYNDIYLTEKITQINYAITKNSIYLNRSYLGYQLQSLRNKNAYKLKILNKLIKQKIIGLSISLKYNLFSLTHKIKSGKSLLLDLISYISLPFNKLKTVHNTAYSFEYIYIQYHQVFIIPKFLKNININYNALILFLELNWHINNDYNSKIIKLITKQLNYNFSSPLKYVYLSYPSYLYHIEYNTSINKYISLYFFSNHTHNLHKKKYIQGSSLLNLYQNDSNIGYGIQFNVPINRIPPIRIEYGINNKKEKFFQLRAYSKYTQYNL